MRRTRTYPPPRPEALEARQLLSADPIGAALTRGGYGVDGRGLTAAVIDTGVNYTEGGCERDNFQTLWIAIS